MVAIAALGLIVALALGWNSPRASRSATWEARALPYRVDVASSETYVSLLDHPSADLMLEVIATPLAGPASGFYDYGLVYRAQDATHYYAFAVGADGYFGVMRVEEEIATPLVTWQQFPHAQRGRRANRLLVTCTGHSCTFRINDEYAATVRDDTWLSGDIGLWARSLEEEAVLQFRSVRKWQLDE
ncbi:MAG: hypothetical protein PVJ55_00865 [Anaerolineae bacterium]